MQDSPAQLGDMLRRACDVMLAGELDRRQPWDEAQTLLATAYKVLLDQDAIERAAASNLLSRLMVMRQQWSRGHTRAVRHLLGWVQMHREGQEVSSLLLVPAIVHVEGVADQLQEPAYRSGGR